MGGLGPAGAPLTDRPHTISSAYEKAGHQRPQLQPYTFSPPESTLTIPEDVEGSAGGMGAAGNGVNGSQDSLPPPPPPKPSVFRRPGSSASNASGGSEVFMRPPSLPGKSTFAPTMAAARQQQILQQYNQHHQV